MSTQYPALLVTIPLLSGFVISAAGWLNRRLCFYIAVIALAGSAFSCFGVLLQVLTWEAGIRHLALSIMWTT